MTRPSGVRSPHQIRAVVLESVVEEYPGTATYRLIPRTKEEADAPSVCDFFPGQFNMLYLPGVGESAISMSGSCDEADAWIHTVRVAGNVTATLAKLRRGDSIGVRGPFGVGWPVDELSGGDVVLVTGGLGLAPVRPLIYWIADRRERFGQVWLVHGSRSPDALLYQREYDDWRSYGIDLQLTVDLASDDWNGDVGPVTMTLDRLPLSNPTSTALVTCGPEPMMKHVAIGAGRLGVAEDRVWLSLERNMQCAAGLCGHCLFGPAFVCKDGPVFRYDRIRPYLQVEGL